MQGASNDVTQPKSDTSLDSSLVCKKDIFDISNPCELASTMAGDLPLPLDLDWCYFQG